MIKFDCPACNTTIAVDSIQDGNQTQCPECKQRLRVSLGGPWLTWPRIILLSGLAGTLCAAFLLLTWFVAGRGPSSPEPDNQVASKPAETPPPSPPPPPTTKPPPAVARKLPELLIALEHSDAAERQMAANELRGQGPEARAAVPALLKLLKDPKERVRDAAEQALMTIGPPAKEHLPLLVNALRDTQCKPARRYATDALGKLAADPKDVLPALVTALKDEDAEVRRNAVAALVDMGKEAAPALAEALTATVDADLASFLACGLGKLKVRNPAVGQALARALDHKEKAVRVTAAASLMELGFDSALLPSLLKALNSDEVEVRRAALNAVPNVSVFLKESPALNLAKESLEDLKPALKSPEPVVRLFGAFALGSLGADAAAATPALRDAFVAEKNRDPNLSLKIRREILIALGEMGPAALAALGDQAEPFLKVLADVATSLDPALRQEQTCAALALALIAPASKESKDAYPVLAKALLLKQPEPPPTGPGFGAPPPTGPGFPGPSPPGFPGPSPPRPGFPGPPPPVAREPEPETLAEKELHERAKKALGKGGVLAAEAVATALLSFAGSEPDKVSARTTGLQVLTRIGPSAGRSLKVKNLVASIVRSRDAPEVLQAAREAWVAINKKN